MQQSFCMGEKINDIKQTSFVNVGKKGDGGKHIRDSKFEIAAISDII